MGIFSSAFVFSDQPVWQQLASLPSPIGLRGYRHNPSLLWLLDFWTGRSPDFPFTAGHETRHFDKLAACSAADVIDRLAEVIDGMYGSQWLRLAAEVSRLTEGRGFFFAADDENYDLAVVVNAGAIECFQLDIEGWRIAGEGDELTIASETSQEDENEVIDSTAIGELRAMPFVSVGAAEQLDGNRPLFRNVLALWPTEYGDPAKHFGLGTWDPLPDVEKELWMEFERLTARDQQPLPATPPKATKPWWQFWQ